MIYKTHWKKLIVMLWILLITGGGGLLAGSYWVGSRLIAPAPAEGFAVPPDFTVEAVRFTSASGASLDGWLMTREGHRGNVVLLHGIRGDRTQFLSRARFLFDNGFNVLMFDFQAHGTSEGNHITFGHHESMDARAAVDFMIQHQPHVSTAVLGVSLGGAAALIGLEHTPIAGLVLEAVYTDIHTAIGNRLVIRFGPVGRYLTPLFTSQIHWRLGFDPAVLSPVEHIKRFPQPTLIIGGANDQRTTEADSRRLFEASTSTEKDFWLIEGAEHQDFHTHQQDVYEQRILRFLDSCCIKPANTARAAPDPKPAVSVISQ